MSHSSSQQFDRGRLQAALAKAAERLLEERVSDRYWIGELANSALATATAISALSLTQKAEGRPDPRFEPLIAAGLKWLARQQNSDGGWGDTPKSCSNISTTMLVLAAWELAGAAARNASAVAAAEAYVDQAGGVAGLRARYGRDKTFAVPILTNAALAGRVSWESVSPLPFEMACFPQQFYRFLQLPVVSYAIPALVAIGQARYFHRPPRNPLVRRIRSWCIEPSLRVLRRMQPASGGYLEAVPLTSFVVMSLAATGRESHPVTQSGIDYLLSSARPDGSWPIDTNLATWNTTLAHNALVAAGSEPDEITNLDWLLGCQHTERHPFTGADPGGWGWSDLSGAVPDSDDTPGALLALRTWWDKGLDPAREAQLRRAVDLGTDWLLSLQNRDGGWPTFCRGWGKLPFDRSGADLTAHVIRALWAWRDVGGDRPEAKRAIQRGFKYLERVQRADGAWHPLWFGNQHLPEEENPWYGTSKVLLAYRDAGLFATRSAVRGLDWLASTQNDDGGWGRGELSGCTSSIEETALAVEALCAAAHRPEFTDILAGGVDFLVQAVESNDYLESSPIGFYFAKLWYHEKLYPPIFTLSALSQAVNVTSEHSLSPTPLLT